VLDQLLDSALVLAVVGATTVLCSTVRTAALTRLAHVSRAGTRP
jgi:hypothetical protein